MASTFSKSFAAYQIASVCISKVLFTSDLLTGLICSFRKDILSSITCCGITTLHLLSSKAKHSRDENKSASEEEREGLALHRTRSVIVLIPQSTFVFPTVYFTLKMLFPSSSSLSHYRETEGTRWGILIP